MNTNQISEYQLKGIIDTLMDKYDKSGDKQLNKTQLANLFNDFFRSINRDRYITQEEAEKAIQAVDFNHNKTISKLQLLFAWKKILNKPVKNANIYPQRRIKDNANSSMLRENNKQKQMFGKWEDEAVEQTQPSPFKLLLSPQENQKSKAILQEPEFINLVSQYIQTKRVNSGIPPQDQNRFSENRQFQTPNSKINSKFQDRSTFYDTNLYMTNNQAEKNPQRMNQKSLDYLISQSFFRNYSPQHPNYQQQPMQQPQQFYQGSPKYTDINRVSPMFSGDKRVGNYTQPPFFYPPYPQYQGPIQNNPNYAYTVSDRKQEKRKKWNKYQYDVDQSFCNCGKWGSC